MTPFRYIIRANNTFVVFLGKIRENKKKNKKKRPTYPKFFGYVTGNTHIFAFGLSKNKGADLLSGNCADDPLNR